MKTGRQNNYFWCEIHDDSVGIAQIVESVPELVRKQYVGIGAFDSGPYFASPEEIRNGWVQFGELAVSPAIEDQNILPRAGYDEWYVLERQQSFSIKERFLSRTIFTLVEPTKDSDLKDIIEDVQLDFWLCLENVNAISFLGDNDFTTIVVTKNEDKFEKLIQTLGTSA